MRRSGAEGWPAGAGCEEAVKAKSTVAARVKPRAETKAKSTVAARVKPRAVAKVKLKVEVRATPRVAARVG